MMRRHAHWVLCTAVALFGFGCEDDDPAETPMADMGMGGMGGQGGQGGVGGEGGMGGVGGEGGMGGVGGEGGMGGVGGEGGMGGVGGDGGMGGVGGEGGMGGMGGQPAECAAEAGDYPGGDWPACISDNGQWNLIDPEGLSTTARIASFEMIADLLWRNDSAPTQQDFIDARIEYAIDQGLDSRVQRRFDAHYPPPPDGATCRDEGIPEQYPDHCVGPAGQLPVIVGAFQAGSEGMEPWVNAARVEAGLLWFLYSSVYKESFSCAEVAKDCDSSWSYYTGTRQLDEEPLGYASYVERAYPAAHRAMFQALLAVRCWRDLDSAEIAMDAALHQEALRQLDTALDRSLAVILIDRVQMWEAASGDAKAAAWAFLEVLGPVIDRAARAQDAAAADRLMAAWDDAATADADAIVADLEMLFPCAE
ncbi:MAG: hypothetical protein R3F65_21085 [bacterium]